MEGAVQYSNCGLVVSVHQGSHGAGAGIHPHMEGAAEWTSRKSWCSLFKFKFNSVQQDLSIASGMESNEY
jgi:hypothetical protein